MSRLEGLSDGVFALALALLVVATSAPRTFVELSRSVREFPAFVICFWLLMMCWHYHYRFFRRYGLEDFLTICLNSLLLLGVLFFVYPLKFLFTALLSSALGLPREYPNENGELVPMIAGADIPDMMAIYSWGNLGIWTIFALMTVHAYRLRDQLELNEVELYSTIATLRAHGITIAVTLLSLLILYTGILPLRWSGMIYMILGPLHGIHGWRSGLRIDSLSRTAPSMQASR